MGFLDYIFGKKKESHNDNVIQDVQEISPQNADNDIVNTRFLNWYVKGLHKSYPQWMKYDCGINDPCAKEQQLVERGLMKHSGTFKGVTDCVLTDKGIEYLEEHKELLFILECKKYYDIEFEDFYSEKKLHDNTTPPELIVDFILDKRIQECPQRGDFTTYRKALLSKAEISEKNRKYEDCLQFYLYTLRLDLTGLDNGGELCSCNLAIAPAIKKAIFKYKEYLTPKMIENCKKLCIPKSITSFEKFKKIVNDILAGKEVSIENYFSEKTLKKYDLPSEEELDREIKKLGKEIDADMPFDKWVKKHKL